jgi:hypothetical protein
MHLPRAAATLGLLGIAACTPAAPGGPSTMGATAPPSATASPGAASAGRLGALAAELAALTGCDSSCCLSAVPGWVLGPFPGGKDAVSVPEARAALASGAPARVKALAALRLAPEMQAEDVDPVAALTAASDDVGLLPSVLVGQAAAQCYPAIWTKRTLGQVALDALRRMTGAELNSAADVAGWRKAHGDLAASFGYWEDALDRAPSDRREPMLAQVRTRPELWLKLVLCGRESAVGPMDAPATAKLVRETLGVPRLVRMLEGHDAWPELDEPSRADLFAVRVFRLGEELREPALTDAMARLWESPKLKGHDWVEAALGISLSRLRPDDGSRLLVQTLDRIASSQPLVLRELATRYLASEGERLGRWFVSPVGDESDVRTAVLEGIGTQGKAALPLLRKAVLDPSFATDSPSVIERLVKFVQAQDASAAFPKSGGIWPKLYKGASPKELEAREREVRDARRDCLDRLRAWLRKQGK